MRFDSELLLQPLSVATDQMESYGVALASRSKLRLFVVSAGRIEEIVHEELDNRKVRHIRTAGTDHSESSSRIQRKADNQIHANLRGFIQKIDALSKGRGLRRFVLAGASELTAELRASMPKVLSSSVIGDVVLPVTASPEKIISATKAAAEKYELNTEMEKVNQLITSASKNGKAVVGLSKTLKAINSGRIWELIYGDALSSPGYACTGCAALFPARATRCVYCGSRVQVVGNIIERAVDRAFRKQARVEVVTEEACAALKKVGGIGAFLKTRTGSL
jgi:peptide subunit release factor 1 (eRF1)